MYICKKFETNKENMRKVFLLAVVVCVAMLTVGTGCSNKKVESADSTNTESTEVDSDTVDDVDSATEVIEIGRAHV